MKGLEFGLVHAIIATVALLLIALGLTYRRATEAASRFRIPGGGIGSFRASPGGPTQQDHSSFMRTGEDELLPGRPSPEYVRSLGLDRPAFQTEVRCDPPGIGGEPVHQLATGAAIHAAGRITASIGDVKPG